MDTKLDIYGIFFITGEIIQGKYHYNVGPEYQIKIFQLLYKCETMCSSSIKETSTTGDNIIL